ncbi:endonuclease domain-containing protein [Rhodohalobacter sp. 8-1]
MTKWEVILWNDLKGKNMLGFKVRRQYGIDNFVIDFYCPELKLAIEVDGDVHEFTSKKLSDSRKNDLLKDEGIKLIRLNNYDLEDDYESIVLYLEDIFKERARNIGIPLITKYE